MGGGSGMYRCSSVNVTFYLSRGDAFIVLVLLFIQMESYCNIIEMFKLFIFRQILSIFGVKSNEDVDFTFQRIDVDRAAQSLHPGLDGYAASQS
jgi:hypothetical protein